ncbi:flavoprotein [Clostridium thailandense]|uniref:flavoprotein n=1 Tax=Clostridium thailandense TaxID=2794346 RepID=UPI00398A4BF1
MNIEEIVKSIVREILPLINKKILIFISGGKVNSESLISTLTEFELIDYKIVMSEAAASVIDKRLIEKLKGKIIDSQDKLNEAIRDAEFVLIPILTRNTLSKVALGMEDNLITIGIARAIMISKEIIAVRDSYDPNNSINISEGFSSNLAYNSMLLNYERILDSFGIKIIDSSEFRETVRNKFYNSSLQPFSKKKINSSGKYTESGRNENAIRQNKLIKSKKEEIIFNSSILTVKDISHILENGVIRLNEGTIITPLAKDYIYNNKLKVEFS